MHAVGKHVLSGRWQEAGVGHGSEGGEAMPWVLCGGFLPPAPSATKKHSIQ